MRTVSGREFARLVERHGWPLLRVSGSHHVYGKAGERARLTVPIHGQQALKTGLLRSLLRSAGLTEDDLV